MVLLQCNSLRRFRADPRLLTLLSRLGNWCTPADAGPADGEGASREFLERLQGMELVEPSDAPGAATHWTPFELAVQRQQNVGGEREDLELEGTAPPAFKPRPSGPITVLPPAVALDARLDEVLTARRSVRTYGPGPLALSDLSALLHHSARATDVVADERLGEQVFHPYPAGGARSELELYVVANQVDGVVPGAHWYDARAHELVLIRPGDDELVAVNEWVSDACGLDRPPQAMLVVTAVFERTMWKYQGIGLSLIARDVGCLYQTLYLVATALGLAPCAVGGGRELDNDRWLGLDPLVESQVGCLLIGTREGG